MSGEGDFFRSEALGQRSREKDLIRLQDRVRERPKQVVRFETALVSRLKAASITDLEVHGDEGDAWFKVNKLGREGGISASNPRVGRRSFNIDGPTVAFRNPRKPGVILKVVDLSEEELQSLTSAKTETAAIDAAQSVDVRAVKPAGKVREGKEEGESVSAAIARLRKKVGAIDVTTWRARFVGGEYKQVTGINPITGEVKVKGGWGLPKGMPNPDVRSPNLQFYKPH